MSIPSIIPPEQRGYAIPDIFVTTEWLAKHISDENVRIVDTDLPEEYDAGHIPGSVNPVDHYYKRSLEDRTYIQESEQFAATMRDLGIDDETLVISYARAGGVYSFRLMWALHYYGHTNVRVLDGGLDKWEAEGREKSVNTSSFAGSAGTFTPKVNSSIFASADRVLDAIDDDSTVLLDLRADDEWNGTNKRGGPRGGRVPGATHLEWKHFNTDGDIPVLKSAEEIRKVLAEFGITPDKNVITY
jgi:thiosulfate/3-mercaptopyruvate sulfurtransferase